MILADTSAWVEYDRATGSAVDWHLTQLIEEGGLLAVTEPVIMEVLVGARSDVQEATLTRLLSRFEMLPFDPGTDFLGAVRIYRRCREDGITPRGMVDCMIAAVAWRTGASLPANDADMARIAQVVGIPLGNRARALGTYVCYFRGRPSLAGSLDKALFYDTVEIEKPI